MLQWPMRQFRSYRLQSFLIVMAIALGIAVITAVAAFIDLSRQAERRFTESVWAREITLQPKEGDWGAFYAGGKVTPVRELGRADDEPVELSLEDVESVRLAIPSADHVYAVVAQFITVTDTDVAFLPAFGVTESYMAANNVEVTSGSVFSQGDFAEKRQVALITPTLLGQARIEGDPLGQKLQGFEIIGVLAENEPNMNANPPSMLIPFPENPYNPIDNLTVVVNDVAKVDQARAELAAFAQKTWGERVNVRSNNVASFRSQQRLTNFVIAALASVGLVVASLNIMSLMLARVLKGGRDIGVLRSLGASRTAIIRRYLADALVLGSLGGVLGVGLGFGLTGIFNAYIKTANPEQAQLYVVGLSLPAVGVGLLLAMLATLLFGLYPAVVAARTNVVDALKGL